MSVGGRGGIWCLTPEGEYGGGMTHLLVVLAIVALFAAIFVAAVWGIVWISRRR